MGGMPEDTSGIDQSVSPENDELPFYLSMPANFLKPLCSSRLITYGA